MALEPPLRALAIHKEEVPRERSGAAGHRPFAGQHSMVVLVMLCVAAVFCAALRGVAHGSPGRGTAAASPAAAAAPRTQARHDPSLLAIERGQLIGVLKETSSANRDALVERKLIAKEVEVARRERRELQKEEQRVRQEEVKLQALRAREEEGRAKKAEQALLKSESVLTKKEKATLNREEALLKKQDANLKQEEKLLQKGDLKAVRKLHGAQQRLAKTATGVDSEMRKLLPRLKAVAKGKVDPKHSSQRQVHTRNLGEIAKLEQQWRKAEKWRSEDLRKEGELEKKVEAAEHRQHRVVTRA